MAYEAVPIDEGEPEDRGDERSVTETMLGAVFADLYPTRSQAMSTLEKLTDYADGYNLYRMEVAYPYDLDRIINYGITDDQSMADAILAEVLPHMPVSFKMPDFGCSSFSLATADGRVLMGRNYDFAINTSAMLVHCSPDNGYASVGIAALSNLRANDPQANLVKSVTSLIAPFVCLDGINEKGVSIAVLTLDSDPVNQSTGKKKITTSLAIRLVLDRASTTGEAVGLLRGYDMFASSGKDYHFYINDASGNGVAVEYDCESASRELVATPVNAVTNFFALYPDRVKPGERNAYGHGKDRYESILRVLERQVGNYTADTAWDALKAAAQELSPGDITSNTQWSAVYDNTDLAVDCVIRRHWGDVFHYDLVRNEIK